MKTYKIALWVLTTLVVALSACSKYGNELSYIEYGTINLELTDAPFPYDFVSEANVTIFKIDARLKNTLETEDTGESEDESNFITLYEGDMTANLLELTNGITKSMGEIEVPVGTYDLVRVYVSEGSVLLSDGTSYELNVPSGVQTGIKVFIKPGIEVASSITSDLLLDFDVHKSFKPKGNINAVSEITGFNFTPVIRAANMSVSGSLSGMVATTMGDVTTPIEGATVSVVSGATVISTTFTDANGGYMFLGLDAGNYRVTLEAMDYETLISEEVTIIAANETNLDFSLVAN